MKRTIFVAALAAAIAVAACTPQPANNSNQSANSNSGANRNGSAATATAPAVTEAEATAREQQVMDAIKNKNWAAFGDLLADDQIYVTSTKVYNQTESIDGLKAMTFTALSLSGPKVVSLGPEAYVITYTSHATGMDDQGRPFPDAALRESSAWVKRGDKWLVIYHQDSEVQTAPAGETTPTPSPAATPAASPAPAPSPAPDAKGREEQIWELLRNKNWDGFASFLAESSIEVEPEGVADKAGTVNGVKGTDFTGVTLSEFKELTLTPNATLVTYLVKSPSGFFAGAGMRHTTIWVNNNGRWLATFHQGTTVKQ